MQTCLSNPKSVNNNILVCETCLTRSNTHLKQTGEVGNVCKTPQNLKVNNVRGNTLGNENIDTSISKNDTNICTVSTKSNMYPHGSSVLNPQAESFETTIPPNICGQSTSNIYSDTHTGSFIMAENYDLRDNFSEPNSDNSYVTNNSNISQGEILEGEGNTVFDQITTLRLKNPKKVMLGHLNINSIPNKFTGIMDLVKNNLDIFLISETKIDSSFPDAQFYCEGYSSPHRRDRSMGAGGLLMYVNENIPSRMLKDHFAPDDIEVICVEINLRKQKWIIIGIYRPPSMNNLYFLENLSRITDFYSCK